MRILIIPDVHLKPSMFTRAAQLLEQGEAGRAVCLMDLADDWDCMFNLDLYIQTYDRAIDLPVPIRTLSGAGAIMMSAIYGIRGSPVTPLLRQVRSAADWQNSGRLFRIRESWLSCTEWTGSCFPMPVCVRPLSGIMPGTCPKKTRTR